jgi:hypothetical protein
MLGDQAVGEFVPDPAVVDSARLRIATHRVLSAQRPIRYGPVRHAEDIQAIHAVIDCANGDAAHAADPANPAHRADVLDVGAALVVLCDLRLYLDGLEADLLDAAPQVGLGWDVIAAIIGIPADQAQRRHRALRAQRRPPQPDELRGPGA